MNTLIALFRGINIGGHHILPMQELTAILQDLGATGVRTCIQSGNAVFRSRGRNTAAFARRLAAEIGKRHGFEPYVLIIEPETLARVIADNPFPEALGDPGTLHVGFLAAAPANPDLAKLTRMKMDSERFHLGDGVFYMHLPEGAGRSKLAAGAEKALGVPMTGRNWNTVCRLMEMVEAAEA
ncbi:MAG: DUF1697 domain-containing protein [Hydrogenophilaceae bacterium]